MTCRALGGPCDHEHHGDSADDVINAQDRHLKDAEAAGDAAHQEASDASRRATRRTSLFAEDDERRASAPVSSDPTQGQG